MVLEIMRGPIKVLKLKAAALQTFFIETPAAFAI